MHLLSVSLLSAVASTALAYSAPPAIAFDHGLAIAPTSPAVLSVKKRHGACSGKVQKCREDIIRHKAEAICSKYIVPKTATATQAITLQASATTVPASVFTTLYSDASVVSYVASDVTNVVTVTDIAVATQTSVAVVTETSVNVVTSIDVATYYTTEVDVITQTSVDRATVTQQEAVTSTNVNVVTSATVDYQAVFTTNIAATVTVTAAPSPNPAKRATNDDIPDWLKKYEEKTIKAACKKIIPEPKPVTVTVVQTSYAPGRTVTVPVNVAQTDVRYTTLYETTQNPVTVTEAISATSTVVVEKASTAVQDVTSTVVVPSTLSTLVRSSYTTVDVQSSTDVITLTSTHVEQATSLVYIPVASTTTGAVQATATVTVAHPCDDSASWTKNIGSAGILNAPSSAYNFQSGLTARQCCLRCHDGTNGCNIWFIFGSGTGSTCGVIKNYSQNPNLATAQCPNGLPDIYLITQTSTTTNVGGPGSCAGPIHYKY